jgi:hypothetical protein
MRVSFNREAIRGMSKKEFLKINKHLAERVDLETVYHDINPIKKNAKANDTISDAK